MFSEAKYVSQLREPSARASGAAFAVLFLFSVLAIFLTPELSVAQSDGWIRGEVRARLLTAGLRPLRIEIRVRNGIVSLRGRAASEEAVRAAESIVSGIPGVKGIENDLRVQPSLLDILRGDPYSEALSDPQQSRMPARAVEGGNSIFFQIAFFGFGVGIFLTVVFLGLLIHRKFEERSYRKEFLGEEGAEEHTDIHEYKSYLDFRRKKKKTRRKAA